MTWFKIDDGLPESEKVIELVDRPDGLAALGLWTLCGAWAAGRGNGGKVTSAVVKRFHGTRKHVAALVEVGMWEPSDEAWQFHDWDDYNEPVETAEARRATRSAASEEANHVRWHVRKGVRKPACGLCAASDSDPTTDSESESVRTPPGPGPVPDKTDMTPLSTSSPYPNARPEGLDQLRDLIDEKTEQATQRAMLLGIRDPKKAWDRLQNAAGVGITFLTAMDLAAMILRDAPPNRAVENPDAYIASACAPGKRHEIEARLASLDVEVLA